MMGKKVHIETLHHETVRILVKLYTIVINNSHTQPLRRCRPLCSRAGSETVEFEGNQATLSFSLYFPTMHTTQSFIFI